MPLLREIDTLGYWVSKQLLRRLGFTAERIATTRGVLQSYQWTGTGTADPVLLLHGVSADGGSFARLAAKLQETHRRIVILEALGHGGSDSMPAMTSADLLAAFLEAFHALSFSTPPVIFGNSMGGGMALWLAEQCPDHIRALVVASPAGTPLSPTQFQALIDSLAVHTAQDGWRFLKRLLYRVPTTLLPLSFLIQARFRREAVVSLLQDIQASPTVSPVQLKQMTLPVHIFWGEADGILPRECADYFRGHLPPAGQFEWLPRVGHSPQLEATDRVADVIASLSH